MTTNTGLPAPTLIIREAMPDDAAALADCVITPIVTTFRGRVPDQCLAWLTLEESAANWGRFLGRENDDGRFLLVAEHPPGRVVGCALGGLQPEDGRFDGELYLLGVLPDSQDRGIGRRLVGETAARLAGQGLVSCGVRVLRANPNTAFYEHLGARYLAEEPYDWNGVILPERVYVWPDVGELAVKLLV